MYYEEKWIDGKLCYRHTPDGEWTEFTLNSYRQALKDLQPQVKNCCVADVVGQGEHFYCYEADDLKHDRCKIPCHFCERV